MRILLALATLTATPVMAHSTGGVHVPHGAYVAAIVVAVVSLAAFNAYRTSRKG